MKTPSLEINDFLDRVDVAAPQVAEMLTLWPLIARGDDKGLAYIPLARALEKGWADVGEVDSICSNKFCEARNPEYQRPCKLCHGFNLLSLS